MSEKIATLHEICLEKTAHLCKTSYWNTNFPSGYNPFLYMPSSIVDELVLKVVNKSTRPKQLERSDLRLLLTSGQVENFILDNVNVTGVTLHEILLDISSACPKLKKICLRKVFINIKHTNIPDISHNFRMQRPSLNILLSKAGNLKEVESCLAFDLELLSRLTKLEKLVLKFPLVRNKVSDFLKIDGQLMPNTSLNSLEIFQHPSTGPVSDTDIAVILQYCTELTEISCDISKSLLYLHGEELINGSITARYKLKRFYLGKPDENIAAALNEVCIAALTCPDVENLDLYVKDDQAIYALSDFKKIKSISLVFKVGVGEWICGDFLLGPQFLLERPDFGNNLTCLSLINFTNVDFSFIGTCCPNLNLLMVEFENENNRKMFSRTSYRKLKDLYLTNCDDINCEKNTLLTILSNATELDSIKISPAGRLTDALLNDILTQNSLANVTYFCLKKCVLTMDGIRKLVSSLKSLKNIYLKTSLDCDEVAREIRGINPRVNMKIDNS